MIPIKDTIPHRDKPFMTWLLIAANIFIFLFQVSLPPNTAEYFVYKFGFVPHNLTALWSSGLRLKLVFYLWHLITCMFLHGSWMHLISNMWGLWLFGDNVEDRIGHLRFLVFYLLSGIVASLAHYVFNIYSTIPAIGASGAIAGVMGAYFIMFPLARIITLVPVFWFPFFFEIPAVVFIGLWFTTQVFSGIFELFGPMLGGGVAWWAHVGGFIFGALAIHIFKKPGRHCSFFDDECYYYQFYY